ITHTATYTFTPQVIDLSDLAGNNYYLGFRTGLTSGTNYIDHIIGPNITPLVPGAPTLTAPADAAVNQSRYPSLSWSAPSTGGVPTGYNVYLDTVDGSTLFASNVTSPYTVTTALDWDQTYYWTVKAFNAAGTGDAPAARSFTVMSDPTIYDLPYIVDFGTVSGDWPVAGWSQLSGFYPTPDGTSAQWAQDDWLNVATPANKAAKINIYGTTRYGWLVTPPIAIPSDGYELKFDVALLDWNGTVPPVAGEQADDKFIVVMSDTPIMSNPTILREWNNDESPYVFDAISHTGSSVTIPLAGVTGTKYFAFYAESSVSGGDNDLMVDNVLIREAPTGVPNPVTLTSPADDADNLPIDGFNLTWSPDNTGATATNFFVLMGTTNDPDNMEYLWEPGDVTTFNPTLAEIDPITFNYSETWYWTVIATNGDGDSEVPTPFSFTIMPDPRVLSLPYSQNFDGVPSSSMPEAWTGFVNSTSTYAYVRTTTSYPVSAPNSMYLTNSSDTSADLRLITPEILVPMNTIKLSFSARAGSVGPNLLVGTVDALDGTGTFNQIASIPLTAAHIVYTISFAEYLGTDQYICFKHGGGGNYRSIYIDNVYMEELVPNDMALNALTGPGFGLAGQLLSYTVEVLNNGTIEQSSYSVQLLSSPANTVLATLNVTEPIAAGATAQHTIDWTPTTAGQYTIFAKVILTGDVNSLNDESATRTVDVFSSDSYIPFVGDPASTTTVNYLPFNMYYKNNVTETIYMPHEMQMATGTINGIVYQNNFVQDLTKPVRIWMKHTTENVNAAWLPFEDYTLVFEGDVHFPLGVNAVVIPLDTPFNYTGGNLAVRTYREFENEYWNSANHFYYTMDANYPNRVRYLNQDGTTPIDPTAPASTGIQTSYIVNTAFIVDPHTELVLTPPAVQIAMSGTNPQLSWNAVYGAYLYVIYGSDDPYDWSEATEVTTSNLIYTITSAPAKKFYKVAARSHNHEERTIGQVLNPASAIGFDNSAVRALPLIPEKGDKK
ncbi:MAG: CARDB domain-containing protein, partial [Candidatus Cloacimonadaceae bacterium]|nr:CARDB domain-containing protein [Candidatus Cloacimonadaceae bacterium]